MNSQKDQEETVLIVVLILIQLLRCPPWYSM